ncbi:MAG: hypothetical protein WCI77_10780 [Candidatus Omnitrophota bacterium]
METKRIEKILAVLLVASFLSCIIYTEAFAWGKYGPGNGPVRQAIRSRFGGGGGSGGSGGCGGGGRGQCGGGSEGYAQSSSGGEQASGGSSGSGQTKSSTKAKEFSTPCTSYTTKIEAGGESMTFEKVPGKQNKFQAGDTDKSPQEIVAKATAMLADPTVRVTTDSRYPSTIKTEIALADTWKTAGGERAGNIPEAKGGGMVDLTVQQTLLSSDVKALGFDAMIGRMGVATSPGTENQVKIGQQTLAKQSAFELEQLATVNGYADNIATTGKYGPVNGQQLQEMAKAQIKANADAEKAAQEALKAKFTPEVIQQIETAINPAEQLSALGSNLGVPMDQLKAKAQEVQTERLQALQAALPNQTTRETMLADLNKAAAQYNLRSDQIQTALDTYTKTRDNTNVVRETWQTADGKPVLQLTRLTVDKGTALSGSVKNPDGAHYAIPESTLQMKDGKAQLGKLSGLVVVREYGNIGPGGTLVTTLTDVKPFARAYAPDKYTPANIGESLKRWNGNTGSSPWTGYALPTLEFAAD